MKVKELIEILSAEKPEALVVLEGEYETLRGPQIRPYKAEVYDDGSMCIHRGDGEPNIDPSVRIVPVLIFY